MSDSAAASSSAPPSNLQVALAIGDKVFDALRDLLDKSSYPITADDLSGPGTRVSFREWLVEFLGLDFIAEEDDEESEDEDECECKGVCKCCDSGADEEEMSSRESSDDEDDDYQR